MGTATVKWIAGAQQDQEPPGTFRKAHLHLRVGGKGLTRQSVAQAIQLTEAKYCSVAATIRATAHITTEFELIEEATVAAPSLNHDMDPR